MVDAAAAHVEVEVADDGDVEAFCYSPTAARRDGGRSRPQDPPPRRRKDDGSVAADDALGGDDSAEHHDDDDNDVATPSASSASAGVVPVGCLALLASAVHRGGDGEATPIGSTDEEDPSSPLLDRRDDEHSDDEDDLLVRERDREVGEHDHDDEDGEENAAVRYRLDAAGPPFLRAHAARPDVILRTLWGACVRDLRPLVRRVLDEVGIEYVLRHCMVQLEGTTIGPVPSPDDEPRGKNDPRTTAGKNVAGAKKVKGGAAGTTLFWVCAYHDAAGALAELADACFAHFLSKADGDPSRARSMLSRLLSTPTKIEGGTTPLLIAAARNSARALKALLLDTRYRLDPNGSNDHGSTPALVAAQCDCPDALRVLAEHCPRGGEIVEDAEAVDFERLNAEGAEAVDFERLNAEGQTPLLAACRSGAVGALRVLCEPTQTRRDGKIRTSNNGGDDDDDDGQRSRQQPPPLVDFGAVDRDGYGPVALAALHDRPVALTYLCARHDPRFRSGPDANARRLHRRPSLMMQGGANMGGGAGNEEVLPPPWDGDSPLHVAVRAGSVSAAAALLRNPHTSGTVDIAARNMLGRTALHVAAECGNVEMAELFARLLSPDMMQLLDSEDIGSRTPLYIACELGCGDVVRALEPSSDVDAMCHVEEVRVPVVQPSGRGKTTHQSVRASLGESKWHGSLGISNLGRVSETEEANTPDEDGSGLGNDNEIEAGDSTARDGSTRDVAEADAGDDAPKGGHPRRRLLRGVPPHPALFAAVYNDRPEAVVVLLSGGADVDALDDAGRTGLDVAAKHGLFRMCQMLASNGANLKARPPGCGDGGGSKGGAGKTPLQRARKHGHLEIVRLLESLGG